MLSDKDWIHFSFITTIFTLRFKYDVNKCVAYSIVIWLTIKNCVVLKYLCNMVTIWIVNLFIAEFKAMKELYLQLIVQLNIWYIYDKFQSQTIVFLRGSNFFSNLSKALQTRWCFYTLSALCWIDKHTFWYTLPS